MFWHCIQQSICDGGGHTLRLADGRATTFNCMFHVCMCVVCLGEWMQWMQWYWYMQLLTVDTVWRGTVPDNITRSRWFLGSCHDTSRPCAPHVRWNRAASTKRLERTVTVTGSQQDWLLVAPVHSSWTVPAVPKTF